MDLNILQIIPYIPSFNDPKNIREGLSKEQWITLRNYLDNDFVSELDGMPTDQTIAKYYRQSFVDVTKLIVWTGLRTSEAFKLKWSDWSIEHEKDIRIGKILVRAEEKLARKNNKPRAFKVVNKVNMMLESRRKHSYYTDDDDYIFAHPPNKIHQGKNIASMRKTFERAMESTSLLYDNKGKIRTMYMFRHTHANLARQSGKHIDDIADDIGNLTTTAQRFYIGKSMGDRLGLPKDID